MAYLSLGVICLLLAVTSAAFLSTHFHCLAMVKVAGWEIGRATRAR